MSHCQHFCSSLFLLTICCFTTQVNAVDYTWIGLPSGDWSSASDWSPAVVPSGAANRAIFPYVAGYDPYGISYNAGNTTLGGLDFYHGYFQVESGSFDVADFTSQYASISVYNGASMTIGDSYVTEYVSFDVGQSGTGAPASLTVNGGDYANYSFIAGENASVSLSNISAGHRIPPGVDPSSHIFTSTGSSLTITDSSLANFAVSLNGANMTIVNSHFNADSLNIANSADFRMEGGSLYCEGSIGMYGSPTAEFRDTAITSPATLSFGDSTLKLTGNTSAVVSGIYSGTAGHYYQDTTGTITTSSFMLAEGGHAEFRGGTLHVVGTGNGDGTMQLSSTTLTVSGPTTRIITDSYYDMMLIGVNLFLHGHGFNPIKINADSSQNGFDANSYNISDAGVGLMVLNDKTVTLMDVSLDANQVSYIKSHMNLADATLFEYSDVTDSTGMKIQINDAAIPQTWDIADEMVFHNDQSLYGEKGSVKILGDGENEWIKAKFSGVTSDQLSDLLYDYLNANMQGSGLILSDDTGCASSFWIMNDIFGSDGYAYFAWDLTAFNVANSSDVRLSSLEVPEPATWVMLLLGGTAALFARRRRACA